MEKGYREAPSAMRRRLFESPKNTECKHTRNFAAGVDSLLYLKQSSFNVLVFRCANSFTAVSYKRDSGNEPSGGK